MYRIKSFLKQIFTLIALTFLISALSSCEKQAILEHGLDEIQLAAGRVAGTWTSPSSIKTPDGVPSDIFGDMRLLFTTDKEGYPGKFVAKNCPIVFSSDAENWAITLKEDNNEISLTDIVPVDVFSFKVNASTLTISFHMGWENTETGEQGEGDFSATLIRK